MTKLEILLEQKRQLRAQLTVLSEEIANEKKNKPPHEKSQRAREMRERIFNLYISDKSFKEIATELKIHPSKANSYFREYIHEHGKLFKLMGLNMKTSSAHTIWKLPANFARRCSCTESGLRCL